MTDEVGDLPLPQTVEEMASFHNWELAPVVESILFLSPHGSRLSESQIRDQLKSVNVAASGLSDALKRLRLRGAIERDNDYLDDFDDDDDRPRRKGKGRDGCYDDGPWFMVRSRHAQLQSLLTGEPVSNDLPKSTAAPPLIGNQPSFPRWARILFRAALVAIITGICSQIGGWVGGVVSVLLASLLAIIIPDIGHSTGVGNA